MSKKSNQHFSPTITRSEAKERGYEIKQATRCGNDSSFVIIKDGQRQAGAFDSPDNALSQIAMAEMLNDLPK